MRGPGSSEKLADTAAWEHPNPVDHAIRVLRLESFKHLYDSLVNKATYTMENDELLELSLKKQFASTTTALPPMLSDFGDKISHSLKIERPAGFREGIVKLDDERTIVRAKTCSRVVELCHSTEPSFVYGKVCPRAAKIEEIGLRKNETSSAMILIGKKKRKIGMKS